jgi:HAD superfamily hydrolase (TIGR01549 family)
VLHALGIRATKEIVNEIVNYLKANNQYEAYILTTIPRFVFDNLVLTGFDPIMTGKEIGRAKPHPNGFLKILSRWNLEPNEVLMVGNDVDCDILPAKELGLKTAFIDREGKVAGEADYNISSLEAIQEIIKMI